MLSSLLIINCLLLALFARHWTRYWRADLTHPLVWLVLGYLLLFPLRALYIFHFGSGICETVLGQPASEFDLAISLAVATFGMSIAVSTTFWATNECRRGRTPVIVRVPCVSPALMICLFIAGELLRAGIVVGYSSGFGSYLTANKDELLRSASGITFVTILQNALINIPIVFGIIGAKTRRASIVIMTGLMLEAAAAIISGSRFGISSVLLITSLALYCRKPPSLRRSLSFVRVMSLIGLVTVAGFVPLSMLRFAGVEGFRGGRVGQSDQSLFEQYVEPVMNRIGGIDSIVIVVNKVPTMYQHTHFISELKSIAYAPIPRAIWPEKPTISFGKVFAEDFMGGYYASGVSGAATLWGHGYIAFGLLGVAIAGVAVACYCAVMLRSLENFPFQRLLLVALAPYLLGLLEQDLVSLFTFHAATLGFYFVILRIVILVSPYRALSRFRSAIKEDNRADVASAPVVLRKNGV